MHPILRALVGGSILLISISSIGASNAQPAPHAREISAIKESSGIEYVSGGIGVDEVARMRELSPRFNVHIRFQNPSDGSSLSDVKVIILNEQRVRLLHIITEGPLLYMKIRPGHYYFAAVYQNVVKEQTLIVDKRTVNMTVSFTINELEDAWRYCESRTTKCPTR